MSLSPSTVIAAAYDDALARDGELLALVGSEVVLLSEVASALVQHVGEGTSVASLVDRLVEEFGAPEDADPIEVVSVLVGQLIDHGVLRAE